MAVLDAALLRLNSRIRNNGLSAKEIITQRDQLTGAQLDFTDNNLSQQQSTTREHNHHYSAKSKSRGGKPANRPDFLIGSLVYIKGEGSKWKGREKYIITSMDDDFCFLQ